MILRLRIWLLYSVMIVATGAGVWLAALREWPHAGGMALVWIVCPIVTRRDTADLEAFREREELLRHPNYYESRK